MHVLHTLTKAIHAPTNVFQGGHRVTIDILLSYHPPPLNTLCYTSATGQEVTKTQKQRAHMPAPHAVKALFAIPLTVQTYEGARPSVVGARRLMPTRHPRHRAYVGYTKR